MATEREKMGRLVLKASTGVHGEIAKKLALELSAALAAPPVGQQAAPVAWTPGPNVFKDWCNQWFGPDADDDYLAKAVFALPPVAQRFSEPAQPIDMVLHCPNCGKQHIDAPEGQFIPGFTADETVAYNEHYKLWTNPPHRSHLCHGCSCIWRPADVPTNGVESIKTDGKADTWPTHAEEVRAQPAPQAGAAEPIYQVSQPYPGDPVNTWRDASEQAYDLHRPHMRRIVYAAHPTEQPSQDAERWQFVLEHAVSGKAPKDKGFDITYVPVGHNGSEWGRIEIEWRGAKWEHITADGVNAIIDAARAAQAQGEKGGQA